ncbi:hypothetical protein HDU98_006055 [Podochytrium sp. JEL0797]|nr:hypothetical protein HDU98_006055 [Podochytrium sp. JEL0797]
MSRGVWDTTYCLYEGNEISGLGHVASDILIAFVATLYSLLQSRKHDPTHYENVAQSAVALAVGIIRCVVVSDAFQSEHQVQIMTIVSITSIYAYAHVLNDETGLFKRRGSSLEKLVDGDSMERWSSANPPPV